MTRITIAIALSFAMAGGVVEAAAQATSVALTELLPAPYGDSAAALVSAARAQGLPVASLALLARQGVVKGMRPEVVLAALGAEARRLDAARVALLSERREPSESEIRAAADALHRGVTTDAIARLAEGTPRDRSLEVAIFVLAGLVDRGVPIGDALSAVRTRMRDGVDDRDLGELPLQVTRLFARGLLTSDVVRALLVMEHGLGDDLVPRNPGVQAQRVPTRQN